VEGIGHLPGLGFVPDGGVVSSFVGFFVKLPSNFTEAFMNTAQESMQMG
jgi:hypothetical protein